MNIIEKLAKVQTMPELDALRKETVTAMQSDGTRKTFESIQGAFRKAKNRLKRVPLSKRTW
jgi:hypothetical protein